MVIAIIVYSNSFEESHMQAHYRETVWYQYLDHGMQDLVRTTFDLLEHEKSFKKPRFHDYGFIVFPIARSYEGFLKKFLRSLELIDEETLYSRYFRIGRSLNPDLPKRLRDNSWYYDDLERVCKLPGGKSCASLVWKAWVEGRNKVFHYFFPDHNRFIDLVEAERLVDQFVEAMDQSVACTLKD